MKLWAHSSAFSLPDFRDQRVGADCLNLILMVARIGKRRKKKKGSGFRVQGSWLRIEFAWLDHLTYPQGIPYMYILYILYIFYLLSLLPFA